MAHNRFGSLFCYTTWGESHGKAIGVVVDGCPAGLCLEEDYINDALARRAPGGNAYTTPRKEKDLARILSGVFEGRTTGAPICLLIENGDADSSKYTAVKDLLRPGHANYTYLQKYGIFDYRGGGRASARETACRVAAGAVAQKVLDHFGISVLACLESVGGIKAPLPGSAKTLRRNIEQSPIAACDLEAGEAMQKAILEALEAKDSLGGVVAFMADGVPAGLGEPVYGKIDAMLAMAMMSIPAAKGVEIGLGFAAASMKGSEHNDLFEQHDGLIRTSSNNAGGCLGGITNGMPLTGRVAFKPTASIMQPLSTVDIHGNNASFQLPEGSRHDPCVAIRAVPVVEAMCRLVLADALLLNQARKLSPETTGLL